MPSQALVDAVCQRLGPVTGWEPLRGGRTNRLWRVSSGDDVYVVKLYSDAGGTPLFPNDPHAEASVLRALESTGLAPVSRGLLLGSYGSALIYDFLPGQSGARDPSEFADLLHKVHQTPPPANLRRLVGGSAALLAQSTEILDECRQVPDHLRACHSVISNIPEISDRGDVSLVHADPVFTNVVTTNAGIKLIDWQCPAIGDPCEDLAIVLSPFMQRSYGGYIWSEEERQAFLDAYPDNETVARYARLAPFYHLRMACYSQWCLEKGRDAQPGDVAAEIEFSEISEIT